MTTSVKNISEQVEAASVAFDGDVLSLTLSDGRIISVPMIKIPWLQWLASASPEQRANWTIEPGGFAVYWESLDDGIEVEHLLALAKLA